MTQSCTLVVQSCTLVVSVGFAAFLLYLFAFICYGGCHWCTFQELREARWYVATFIHTDRWSTIVSPLTYCGTFLYLLFLHRQIRSM